MYIKQLELKNFQKHESLILDFSPNVNVLYGKTDCGKSTIIRAIRWIFYPLELRGDVVRREGSKKTSVKMTLDNDAIIERIKSATVNAYKLTVNGETKEYNAIGNSLPEDIQTVLKITPIGIDDENLILNVSNQLSMPFLLDKSGSFRQKLFNKLTGNDVVDKVFQDLNKDILQIGRDERTEKERLEDLKSQFNLVEEKRKKFSALSKEFEKVFTNLKHKEERLNRLTELLNSLNEIEEDIRTYSEKIRSIKTIGKDELQKLKEKIDKFERMSTLRKDLERIYSEFKKVDVLLNNTIVPKIDTKELSKKIDKLLTLQKLSQKISSVNKTKQTVIAELAGIIPDIERLEEEKKEILKSIKICPFFGKECQLSKEIK